MIKGCQKKIVMVKPDRKSPFEFAYFVLKKDFSDRESDSDYDMIKEANSIIEESQSMGKRQMPRRFAIKYLMFGIFFMALGFSAGFLFAFLVL